MVSLVLFVPVSVMIWSGRILSGNLKKGTTGTSMATSGIKHVAFWNVSLVGTWFSKD